MEETERDRLASHNERVKLFAGSLNAVGLGLIGFAILRPLTDGLLDLSWRSYVWAVVGLALHVASHYVLMRLRREVRR